jgi:hypothetical protein
MPDEITTLELSATPAGQKGCVPIGATEAKEAAMDFFTVPTLIFSVLYCFFIISHDRRSIVHFNVSRHPTASL